MTLVKLVYLHEVIISVSQDLCKEVSEIKEKHWVHYKMPLKCEQSSYCQRTEKKLQGGAETTRGMKRALRSPTRKQSPDICLDRSPHPPSFPQLSLPGLSQVNLQCPRKAFCSTVSPPYLWVLHPQIQTTAGWKYSGKKIPESSKKQKLNLPRASNYLHSIYIEFTTIYIAFTLYCK